MQQRNSLLKFRLLHSREKKQLFIRWGRRGAGRTESSLEVMCWLNQLAGCVLFRTGRTDDAGAEKGPRGTEQPGRPPCPAVSPPSLNWARALFCCSWGGWGGFKRFPKRLEDLELFISEKSKQRNNLKEPQEGSHTEKSKQLISLWAENRKCVIKTTFFPARRKCHQWKGLSAVAWGWSVETLGMFRFPTRWGTWSVCISPPHY